MKFILVALFTLIDPVAQAQPARHGGAATQPARPSATSASREVSSKDLELAKSGLAEFAELDRQRVALANLDEAKQFEERARIKLALTELDKKFSRITDSKLSDSLKVFTNLSSFVVEAPAVLERTQRVRAFANAYESLIEAKHLIHLRAPELVLPAHGIYSVPRALVQYGLDKRYVALESHAKKQRVNENNSDLAKFGPLLETELDRLDGEAQQMLKGNRNRP